MASIKWRKKDEISLKKKVKSYNSKIARELKKGTSTELLPEKVSFKELKKKVATRKDFNREMDLLDDFTTRYAMNVTKTSRGGLVPNWLRKQTETKVKEINKRRAEQRKIYENTEVTDRNKPLGVQAKEFKEKNLAQFNPKKVNFDNMSRKDIEAFKKGLIEYDITKQQKDNLYRENLYKSIENTYSEEQARKLKNILDKLDTDTIVGKYYTDINMDIDFNYDPNEANLRYGELFNAWSDVLKTHKKKK